MTDQSCILEKCSFQYGNQARQIQASCLKYTVYHVIAWIYLMDTALQEAENDARKLKDLLIPPKTKMDVNYDLKNELNNIID